MNVSIFSFVLTASITVKIVILILTLASMFSWTIIIQRFLYLKKIKMDDQLFTKEIWSSDDFGILYRKICLTENTKKVQHSDFSERNDALSLIDNFKNSDSSSVSFDGLQKIFYAGYSHYFSIKRKNNLNTDDMIILVERTMHFTMDLEIRKFSQNLQFLATVGSTAPYVGLFGTVWGIMNAFRSLGGAQQATIAMVAPGISEALITTAIGLFAAIPAVVAYNKFAAAVEDLESSYNTFVDTFVTTLYCRERDKNQYDEN